MITSKREWALELASKGFQIFRVVHNTKVPEAGYSWKQPGPNGMTIEPDRINLWFDLDPDMNYGVCPKGVGVIIDLDIKGERDGTEFLKKLEYDQVSDQRIFERTFTVRTPSGGLHLYLTIDTEVGNANSFDKELTAIDVRGWGGYVVGPGCSIGPNSAGEVYKNHGDYEVILNESILPCPLWIEDGYLKKPGERVEYADVPLMDWDMPVNIAKATDYLMNHPPAIQGQNGDDLTYQLAAQLRDFCVSTVKAVELMFSTGWNARCEPPWDHFDLESTVENSYRYGQNRPGSKADFLGMAFDDGIYEQMMADVEAYEDENKSEVASHRFSAVEFFNRGMRRDYLIPGWVPLHGITAVNAIRGTGKSTIFLDMALRLASDMDWHSIACKKNYKVIYLCGEDDEGLELNYVGWLDKHDMIPEDFEGRIWFYDGVPNLMSGDDVKRWFEDMHEFVGNDNAVIFLDTWQRASSHAGQNKDEDMQLCVHHAEKLAESLNGPILVAFHPPKHNENTILGHSVMENITSAIMQLKVVPEGVRAEITRIKGQGHGNYATFHFDQFLLEEKDEFDNKRSVIVPRKVGGTEEDATPEAMNTFEKKRMIVGNMVRGWIEHNESLPEAERVDVSDYSRAQIGLGVEFLSQNNAEFKKNKLNPLADHNITGFGNRSVEGMLNDCFVTEHPQGSMKHDIIPKPLNFGDGVTLGIKKKSADGKRVIFVLVPSEETKSLDTIDEENWENEI